MNEVDSIGQTALFYAISHCQVKYIVFFDAFWKSLKLKKSLMFKLQTKNNIVIKRYQCFHFQANQLVPLLLDAGVLFMYLIISKIFFHGFTTPGTKYDPHHRSGGEPTTLDRRLDSSTLGRHDGIDGGGCDATTG